MLNDKKNILSFRISWPLVIVLICILMSIGYTTVNYVSLAVDGDAVALIQKGVFVSDIQYKNGSGSSKDNNLLKVVSGTIINSYVELSSTDSSSYVTYTISVLNNGSNDYEFSKAVFDENFYNNTNIIIELNNTIEVGTVIKSGEELSFDVTFKYKSDVTPSSSVNKLDAYVNFEFVPIAILKPSNSDDTRYFKNPDYIDKIRTINIERGIDIPNDVVVSWDIGVSQTGNVMSFLVINESDPDYYDLYIQSDTQLYAAKYMGSWFRGLKAAERINGLELMDTSQTTSMIHMFTYFGSEAESVELNVNCLDTTNNTSTESMFNNLGRNSTNVVLILDEFDTSKVTNMKNMFYKTARNSPSFVLDVSNLDTSNVTTMEGMFQETGYASTLFELDVSGFDTKNVTSMSNCFYNTGYTSPTFNLDVSGFDTSNVINMSGAFRTVGYSSSVMTLDVSNFNTSKVTNMDYMFNKAGYSNPNFTLDVSGFDTSNVTDMRYMFYQVGYANYSFQLDVSNFNTENVTDFSYMFYGVGQKNTSLVLDVSGFNTSKATDMSGMFYYVGHQSLVLHLDVSNFDTSNVTNMNSMFKWAGHENPNFYLDVSGFDTSKVTDMGDMFRANGIRNPNFTLDVSNFDTSNVTNMEYMFYWAGAITTDFILDLGGFDTSKVTSMYNMFNGSKVKTIYVSDKWNTSNVTSSGSMFSSCNNLVGGLGTTYTSSFTDKTYARIDGGPSQPGYFTLRPEGYRMLNYIESTGTQYIDTGFIPNQDTSVYMVATPLEIDNVATGHGFAPFGTAVKYNDSAYQFYIYSKAFQFNYNDTSTQAGNIGVAKAGQKVIINTQKNITTLINGTENLVFEDAYATFTAPVNLTLFALSTPSKASISGDMRLYSTKIWDNEVLIRDYVPCINSSGEAGLYDFVNNQFYGNSGTGTFKTR